MNFIEKLLMEVLDSGKTFGYKGKATDITQWLKNNSKVVGEELGNALSGKAKRINDKLVQGELYDRLFTNLDDVAKQYPDATISVAAKNAKKGGYKIAKLTVKNGDEIVYNRAVSVTDDLTLKSRQNFMGRENAISVTHDAQNIYATQVSKAGTAKMTYNTAQKTAQMELNCNGEQVAIVDYVNKGGNANRGGITYEITDDLVSGQMHYNEHEVSLIGDTKGLKQWGKKAGAVSDDNSGSNPITLKILRPLRERFNTAIDLFKYNGRKNYENFLSEDEMKKVLEELKSAKAVSIKKYADLAQINDDIRVAEELIRITI